MIRSLMCGSFLLVLLAAEGQHFAIVFYSSVSALMSPECRSAATFRNLNSDSCTDRLKTRCGPGTRVARRARLGRSHRGSNRVAASVRRRHQPEGIPLRASGAPASEVRFLMSAAGCRPDSHQTLFNDLAGGTATCQARGLCRRSAINNTRGLPIARSLLPIVVVDASGNLARTFHTPK